LHRPALRFSDNREENTMALTQKIEIELNGLTERDLELALEEACERINAGYGTGQDSNDTGSFSFSSVTEGEPELEDDDDADLDEGDDAPGLR
jgi:hypothetical protein